MHSFLSLAYRTLPVSLKGMFDLLTVHFCRRLPLAPDLSIRGDLTLGGMPAVCQKTSSCLQASRSEAMGGCKNVNVPRY